MPIVFIHGVNNRKSDSYSKSRLLIRKYLEKYFKGVVVGGKTLETVMDADTDTAFPYWGDLATKFAWNMASLPREIHEDLGTSEGPALGNAAAIIEEGFPQAVGSKSPLLTVAKEDFQASIELLTHLLVAADQDEPGSTMEDVANFVVRAQTYAQDNQKPDWLTTLTSDQQFLAILANKLENSKVEAINSLGPFTAVGNFLTETGEKLKQKVANIGVAAADKGGDFASTKFLAKHRGELNLVLGQFFGDVFIYFDSRGNSEKPGEIPMRIGEAIRRTRDSAPDEPLVLLAHSLGGVITYDYLTHYAPDLKVDILITVGSQVSHFEELKLYHNSDRTIPSSTRPRVSKPNNVAHWLNIYDEVDIFSYACESVFEGVHDFRYDTKTYVIKAHSAYFEQDRFYARLKERTEELR